MKLLVSGCSLSAGFGLPLGINDPGNWPNLLSAKLNAELTNVSVSGYDNSGIFLNAIKELTANDYDLILIQTTALNRLLLSPTMHGLWKSTTKYKAVKEYVSESDYQKFLQVFTRLNQDIEHWRRLINMIETVQNLVKKGYNIKFVNGLLDWDSDFFQSYDSEFARRVISDEYLFDNEVDQELEHVNQDKQKIDLSLWINPTDSLFKTRVDSIGTGHPGIKSQAVFADMIFKKLSL